MNVTLEFSEPPQSGYKHFVTYYYYCFGNIILTGKNSKACIRKSSFCIVFKRIIHLPTACTQTNLMFQVFFFFSSFSSGFGFTSEFTVCVTELGMKKLRTKSNRTDLLLSLIWQCSLKSQSK